MIRPKFYKHAYLYLALGFLIVLVGFSKTYFNQLGEMPASIHLHGISATLWMILLIVQPLLYRTGKLKLHKILGWISLVLVPLIIIGGVIMMRSMIQRQAQYPPDTVYMLAFIDICTLLGFLVLYFLALYNRKNLKLHARFMVSTIFGPIVPALTRVFLVVWGIVPNFTVGLTYTYILIELVLLFIIWKERKMKEVKYTYVPFFLFIAIQHVLMYFANDWSWWQSFMNMISDYSA